MRSSASTLATLACGKLENNLMTEPDRNSTAPSALDPVLGAIVDRLVETYHPRRIYLFGSAGRGDATADSDYDLMVLVPDDMPPALRDSGRAYRALWRLGAAVDVLVWPWTDFESRLHLRASLPAAIEREGKLLYAA
jgi:predicted nucleotidyltransferase